MDHAPTTQPHPTAQPEHPAPRPRDPAGRPPGPPGAARPRAANPAMAVPGALAALTELAASVRAAATGGGLPPGTLDLVHLRASQINGCAVCVGMHARDLRRAGEDDERIDAVAAWRDAACFSAPERAALALAECATRLADRNDPVPDAVWDEAARHYGEAALAALVTSVGLVNLWNRVNVATRQVAGPAAG